MQGIEDARHGKYKEAGLNGALVLGEFVPLGKFLKVGGGVLGTVIKKADEVAEVVPNQADEVVETVVKNVDEVGTGLLL